MSAAARSRGGKKERCQKQDKVENMFNILCPGSRGKVPEEE